GSIRRSTLRIVETTDLLREALQALDGKISLARNVVELGQLAEEAAKDYRERGQPMLVLRPSFALPLQADADRLLRVLSRLIAEAATAEEDLDAPEPITAEAPEPPCEVVVSLAPASQDGRYRVE